MLDKIRWQFPENVLRNTLLSQNESEAVVFRNGTEIYQPVVYINRSVHYYVCYVIFYCGYDLGKHLRG